MPGNTIRLTRQELYDQVWSMSMVKLAKKLGLSDVGLRKRCKKLNIPVPVVGYWQKKEHGKACPPQPPLPKLKGEEEIEFNIEIEREESRPVDKEQYKEAETKIAFEKQDKNQIHVPSTLRSPHPYVAMTKRTLKNADPSSFGRDDGFLSYGRGKHLDIRISKDSLNRTLLIMNALIKALDSRGFKVSITTENRDTYYPSYKTCVSILGQTIEFGLREYLKQEKRKLTKAERKKRPWANEFELNHNPSGRLTLEIKTWGAPRKSWSDAKIQRIEDCLNDFIVGVIKTAVELRTRDIEREQEKQERIELERQRQEIAKQSRVEEAKLKDLLDKSAGWQKSKQIREYIEAVKEDAIQKYGEIEPGSALDKWLAWANQQADRLDPLAESPPSVLGSGYNLDLE